MIRKWLIDRMSTRPRLCIFCGVRPRQKNNEHIIPQWLIGLTGDPNRLITLGPFVSQNLLEPGGDILRTFSFDSFAFPSCTECNSHFAELEGLARPRITKLVNAELLSSNDFKIMLDWFDKVRVGLWLGYHYYLDHNYWGISPQYYIRDRIGAADRALAIIRAKNYEPGIRFAGVNTPAFAHFPSCFTLIINEWFLINISNQFIVSQAAGVPYPETIELNADEQLLVTLKQGTGGLSFPLLPLTYDRSGTTIAEAIFPETLPVPGEEEDETFAEDLVFSSGESTSPILIEAQNEISIYPDEASHYWFSKPYYDFYDLIYLNAIDTLGIQNQLIERIPVSESVPPEQKEYLETEFANCIEANLEMMEWLENPENK
jgi:hypothetical protein